MNPSIKDCDVVADYYDIFNEEVKQFFDPFANNDIPLRSSRVHMDSRVRWLQDARSEPIGENLASDSDDFTDSDNESNYETAEEYEEEVKKSSETELLGTFWSASEKTLFFHCLSRYSIHRLEEWRSQLPAKSEYEIMVYYWVLKHNLNLLKRSDMKRFGGILSRIDLPIAYEMDEFFVDFEEQMSARVRIETDKVVTEEEGNDNTLISVKSWSKRWPPIYSNTGIQELLPICKEPLPFSQEALTFMTQCCRDYTRRLLTSIFLTDLERISVPTSLFRDQAEEKQETMDHMVIVHSKSAPSFPRIITKEQVFEAINLLKHEGLNTPTLGETVLRTLDKFQLRHQKKGKLFKNKHVTKSLVSTLVSNFPFANAATYYNVQESQPDSELDLVVAQKLHKLNGGHPPRKKRRVSADTSRFPEDDTLDRIDNPFELELCDWETQLMDKKDTRRSRLYQHELLAYFSRQTTPVVLTPLSTDPGDQSSGPVSTPVPFLTSSMVNRYLHTNT